MLSSHLAAAAAASLSARLFLFCFFSAAALMYRTTPLPSPPTSTSHLRDELLRDVLRYTLDRGIFIVSCGNDAERTVTSAPIALSGVVLETSRHWRAGDCCCCCCGGMVECCSLPPLVGIVIAPSRWRSRGGGGWQGETGVVRASLVPGCETNEASLNPQLGKREKKAQVKS